MCKEGHHFGLKALSVLSKRQRALCIPWKTALCFLKRDSCFFSPGTAQKSILKFVWGTSRCRLSRMQTNYPTHQRRTLAGHSKLCCPCTSLYGRLSAGTLVNSSTHIWSQSRHRLNTWSPHWSAWTGWDSVFLEQKTKVSGNLLLSFRELWTWVFHRNKDAASKQQVWESHVLHEVFHTDLISYVSNLTLHTQWSNIIFMRKIWWVPIPFLSKNALLQEPT